MDRVNNITNKKYLFYLSLLTIGFSSIYVINLNTDKNVIYLPLDANCQLHIQSCTVQLSSNSKIIFTALQQSLVDKDFSLGFSPTEMLNLSANFKNLKVDKVGVIIVEKDTYSRYLIENQKLNSLEYELYSQTSNNIHFNREIGLSVCVNTLIEWIVLVKVTSDNTQYHIPFEFETSMTADEHEV